MAYDSQIPDRETKVLLDELGTVLDLSGDVVEFGCYAGDTSVLLAQKIKDTDKWLWLYDSFEGLPEKTAEDRSASGWRFKAGELRVSEDTVAHKFNKYKLPDPVIKKAWFDELDKDSDLPNEICFALLDGDFYNSIKTSLELVVGKMVDGGIIVVHDYRNQDLPGSAKAVNEFIEKYPDYGFRVAGSMAIISVKR